MQLMLVDRLMLGFEHILKQITQNRNIRYVEFPTVGRSTRMHYIYQNLD